ncbi:NAD(P)-dependent oxidoreductase [Larkinella harenae]
MILLTYPAEYIMEIFVYADLAEEDQQHLKNGLPPDAKVIFASSDSGSDVPKAFQSCEFLFGNPPVGWLKEVPSSLKLWQLESVGFEKYQNVDFEGTVVNVGDISAQPCAETIVSGVLAFYRGVHQLIRYQLNKEWVADKISNELHLLGKKKVIILGSGAIGMHVKKLLSAFGCSIQMTAKQDPEADIHSFEELLENLPQTDLIINTLPGNLDNYVSEQFFDTMKKGSLYASVGRGTTTDEEAMIRALEAGQLLGAVLDVTQQEPLEAGSPLWTMDNVILTQHTGAAHQDENKDKVDKFLSNLSAFLDGESLADEVTLKDGY